MHASLFSAGVQMEATKATGDTLRSHDELVAALPDMFPRFGNFDRDLSHGSDALHNLVLTMAKMVCVCCGHKKMSKLVCYILCIQCRILRVSQHYRENQLFAAMLKEVQEYGHRARCVL